MLRRHVIWVRQIDISQYPFPVDMLRQEYLLPFRTIDSFRIEESYSERAKKPIALIRFTSIDWRPNKKKWAKYGWIIVSHEIDHPDGDSK